MNIQTDIAQFGIDIWSVDDALYDSVFKGKHVFEMVYLHDIGLIIIDLN